MSNSKSPRVEWPTFDSMMACSGATGIPMEVLKRAKADGCAAFHSNRIYFVDLLPWLFSGKNASGIEPKVETWSDKLDKQKFEERAGILLEYEKAMAILRSALMPLRQFLLSMSSTLSVRCNPSDPELARRAIDLHVKQGMRMIADAEREKIAK